MNQDNETKILKNSLDQSQNFETNQCIDLKQNEENPIQQEKEDIQQKEYLEQIEIMNNEILKLLQKREGICERISKFFNIAFNFSIILTPDDIYNIKKIYMLLLFQYIMKIILLNEFYNDIQNHEMKWWGTILLVIFWLVYVFLQCCFYLKKPNIVKDLVVFFYFLLFETYLIRQICQQSSRCYGVFFYIFNCAIALMLGLFLVLNMNWDKIRLSLVIIIQLVLYIISLVINILNFGKELYYFCFIIIFLFFWIDYKLLVLFLSKVYFSEDYITWVIFALRIDFLKCWVEKIKLILMIVNPEETLND